jgi:hypothetical protein
MARSRRSRTSRSPAASSVRIQPDLVAYSVATWAAVPIHLGARSERSDEWMVRLTLSWPRNRFPSSCALRVRGAPGRERCGPGGRRSRRRSSDRRGYEVRLLLRPRRLHVRVSARAEDGDEELDFSDLARDWVGDRGRELPPPRVSQLEATSRSNSRRDKKARPENLTRRARPKLPSCHRGRAAPFCALPAARQHFASLCVFRPDPGARSHGTWAPVPTRPGRPFRRTWAPIPVTWAPVSGVTLALVPEHLGTGSGVPGRRDHRPERRDERAGRHASAADASEEATTRGCRSDTQCEKFERFFVYGSRSAALSVRSRPRQVCRRGRSATT